MGGMINWLSRKQKSPDLEFANLCGANTPTKSDFKLPVSLTTGSQNSSIPSSQLLLTAVQPLECRLLRCHESTSPQEPAIHPRERHPHRPAFVGQMPLSTHWAAWGLRPACQLVRLVLPSHGVGQACLSAWQDARRGDGCEMTLPK